MYTGANHNNFENEGEVAESRALQYLLGWTAGMF